VVDRQDDRAAMQRHPSRLDRIAESSTWDGITPYGSTGWGRFSEEECGSSGMAQQCHWWPWRPPETGR